jgi:hypothetical protein
VAECKGEIDVMRPLDFPHLLRYIDHCYVRDADDVCVAVTGCRVRKQIKETKTMWIALELAERGSVTSILDAQGVCDVMRVSKIRTFYLCADPRGIPERCIAPVALSVA